MAIDTALIAVVGSVLLAVVGYLLNGIGERSFEKRKVNYSVKLGMFQELNSVVKRMVMLYWHLAQLESMNVRDNEAIAKLSMMVDVFQRLPLPAEYKMGPKTLFESSDILNPNLPDRSAVVTSVCADIISHYVAAMAYFGSRFEDLTWNVELIADTREVKDATSRINIVMIKELTKFREANPWTGKMPALEPPNKLQEMALDRKSVV